MMIDYQSGTIGYLDITFGPKWDYIPLTRVYIENFLQINCATKDNIRKIEIAASELLENAVKYSTLDGIRMKIHKTKAEGISLSVFSHSTKSESKMVIDLINDMNQQDSLEYYVKKMKESVKKKEDGSYAGLGFARIYHETKAQISVTYHDEEQVLEINAFFE